MSDNYFKQKKKLLFFSSNYNTDCFRYLIFV